MLDLRPALLQAEEGVLGDLLGHRLGPAHEVGEADHAGPEAPVAPLEGLDVDHHGRHRARDLRGAPLRRSHGSRYVPRRRPTPVGDRSPDVRSTSRARRGRLAYRARSQRSRTVVDDGGRGRRRWRSSRRRLVAACSAGRRRRTAKRPRPAASRRARTRMPPSSWDSRDDLALPVDGGEQVAPLVGDERARRRRRAPAGGRRSCAAGRRRPRRCGPRWRPSRECGRRAAPPRLAAPVGLVEARGARGCGRRRSRSSTSWTASICSAGS